MTPPPEGRVTDFFCLKHDFSGSLSAHFAFAAEPRLRNISSFFGGGENN